jgi:hypothetical protein
MGFVLPTRDSLGFYNLLKETIPPKNVSDRTCFRRVAAWLSQGVKGGRWDNSIYLIVLDYAKEARDGGARNPAAVFMSILQKELQYPRSGGADGSQTEAP